VNDDWVEGRFEGSYEGGRVARARGAAHAKRFSLRLRSGVVHDVEAVSGPFAEDPDVTERHEIRQDRVGGIRLAVAEKEETGKNEASDVDPRETSLFDVRIVDWRLSRPAEANGRSHGRIEGTIRARLTPPQPEPVEDELPAPSPEAPPTSRPAAAPGRSRRARSIERRATASRRSTFVEGTDPETIYDRLIWLTAITLALGVAAMLASACGSRVAWTWLAAIGGALGLRRLARSAIRAGSTRQGWLAMGLVTAQTLLWLEPAAHGASLTCFAPSPMQMTGLGVAVVGAGLLRGRAALLVTSLVWTLAVCSWCVALDGACTVPAAASSPALAPDPHEHRPAPRTSPDGHWPVMPGRRQGAGNAGAGDSGAEAGIGAAAGGWSAETGGGGDLPIAGGGGASTPIDSGGGARFMDGDLGAAPLEGASPPSASSRGAPADLPGPPTRSPAEPITSRRGGSASTRGGWVAADHRSASAGAALISIEHANRVPDAFFDSGGSRRVYVPTDPIFEPGDAAIRSTGALQLGRIAALLDFHPERHVVLEVHTDVGGGLDAQQRSSEARAASVRGWLLDRGHLDGDRFAVIGAGGAHPLVPPDGSYAAQQPNRRIEIRLTE